MRDLLTRLKEGLTTATDAAKRKAAETKQKIDKRLNQTLFEGIIAGCVLIMNTSRETKSAADRTNEEHKLLKSLAEKGITQYFTQEEIAETLAKFMSVYESGHFLAGYGLCVAAMAQLKKEADIATLIRFMYDVSAADGHADPEERQTIVDVAGFLNFANYMGVEPELTGYTPYKMIRKPDGAAPPSPPPSPEPPKTGGIPDWMK